MTTILQALAWKEWREVRWKLVAVLGTLLLSLTVLWGTSRELHISNVQIAILLPILPIAVLIATTTAAHERSQGTLPFLCALPISQRRVAVAKLAAGLATCLVPVFVVLALVYVWRASWDVLGVDLKTSMRIAAGEWRGPFNILNWFAATGTVVTLWVVSLFLWSAAAGVNRADEVSAGATALALMAGVWLVFLGLAFCFGSGEPDKFFNDHPTLMAYINAIAPGGFPHLRPLNFASEWSAWGIVGTFFAVQVSLFAWFATQFGRTVGPRIKSPRSTAVARMRLDWLESPRRSTPTAIGWKQFRESGPLALAGLGGLALIVVVSVLATAKTQQNLSETKDVAAVSALFGSIYVGVLTTAVIGIGVFLRDLEAGIHTFWRSRPIDPDSWYWIKFATGLALVGLTFFVPMLFAPMFLSESQFVAPDHGSEIPSLQMISAATILAAYAIGVATTCLTRSAVFATVLTMLGLYLAAVTPVMLSHAYRWLSSPIRPVPNLSGEETRPLIVTGLLLAGLAGAIIGWLAVRNDWGRRSGS